jgi:hypothetical protein
MLCLCFFFFNFLLLKAFYDNRTLMMKIVYNVIFWELKIYGAEKTENLVGNLIVMCLLLRHRIR